MLQMKKKNNNNNAGWRGQQTFSEIARVIHNINLDYDVKDQSLRTALVPERA